MNYVVAYDILEKSVNYSNLYALFAGVGVAWFILGAKNRGTLQRIVVVTWLVVWIGAFSTFFLRHRAELMECKELLSSGRFDVVEGRVENFHAMPRAGHDTERFTVRGVPFSYSDFDESHCGFNNTVSHGGPIRGGAHVRLSYSGNRILKVEIAKRSAPE